MAMLVLLLKGVSSILMLGRAQLQMKVTAELPRRDILEEVDGPMLRQVERPDAGRLGERWDRFLGYVCSEPALINTPIPGDAARSLPAVTRVFVLPYRSSELDFRPNCFRTICHSKIE